MRRAVVAGLFASLLAWLGGCDRPTPAPTAPTGSAGSSPSPTEGDLSAAAAETTTPPTAIPALTSAPVANVARDASWKTIPHDALCVTSGAIAPGAAGRFSVDAPTFRAVSSLPSDTRAQLAFTYLGPTTQTRALGSGDIRRQLGLKLRAQNACNLLYVMWRLEPEAKIAVQTKSNPGQRTSRECGNRGYATVKGRSLGPLPAVTPGSSHVLRADVDGDRLTVLADGTPVWQGTLPAEALAFDGPVGVRTDNVRLDAELLASGPRAAAPCGVAEDNE
jgi:hypothetical protein